MVSEGRFSCVRSAADRDEPLFATASVVRRWILLEQPGSWGRDAIAQSRLAPETATSLARLSQETPARLILIRRHGREDPDAERRSCYVAYTGPQASWVERFDLEEPEDLLTIDLEPLASGESVGGEQVMDPLYLVCTNGSHDPCCAEYGRPLAKVLDAERPASTWESSHIGGDRFAGNLVCFPHGLYFGRVEPDHGVRTAALYEEGRIDLPRYRGRSAYPFHVQAAEHYIRATRGIDGIDALRFVARESLGDDRVRVVFDEVGGSHHVAELQVRRDEAGQLLTCHAAGPACPPRYELLGFDVS